MSNSCLVTGAGGSIGGELVRQLVNSNQFSTIYINDISEFSLFSCMEECKAAIRNQNLSASVVPLLENLSSKQAVRTVKEAAPKIDVVYHTAAYKHVGLSMMTPLVYYRNNIFATENAIEIAKYFDCPLVHISTDKAVWPTNHMGYSKRICEFLFGLSSNKRENFKIVRFGNVLNSNGSVIPIFQRQIAEGGPVTVTDRKATRYFMSISEAVSLVLNCAATTGDCKINVLDMGEPHLIDRLARNLIEQQGFYVSNRKNSQKEIEIQYIGLREGEKLHEQLTYTDLSPTNINGINKANENYSFEDALVEDIVAKVTTGDFSILDQIDWKMA